MDKEPAATTARATLAKWCHGDKQCPITAAQGAATVAYVATASYDDIAGANGQFFELCAPAASVRSKMVNRTSEQATLQYQAELFDMAQNWTAGKVMA